MGQFNTAEFNEHEFNDEGIIGPVVDEWRLYDSTGSILLWSGLVQVPPHLLEHGKTYILMRFSPTFGATEIRITMPQADYHVYDSLGG